MNPLNNIQNPVTTANHESMNLKEESQMKTTNNTSKWNIINSPVKMVLGLAAGAMIMTAAALPSNVSADLPSKTFTSEFELMIQAEIDDAAYFLADLTAEQHVMVMAEIDDGVYLPGYVSAEQQLLTQAEIEDGFALEVSVKETNGMPSPAEHRVMIRAEMEDGDELYFLAGEDALADIANWREPDGIAEAAYIVVAPRQGAAPSVEVVPESRLIWLQMPHVGISSTLLRELAGRGASLRYLVPEAVAAYISDMGLYSDSSR